FALGGILCQVLTGRPPYTGRKLATLVGRAAAGDLEQAHARLDGCGADAELVALAKQCLSADLAQRPRDGGAVAGRVGAYLAGVQERLRQAEVERAAAQAKAAEARKRQRLAVALAAAVLLALVGFGGVSWYVWQQRVERQAQQTARALWAE